MEILEKIAADAAKAATRRDPLIAITRSDGRTQHLLVGFYYGIEDSQVVIGPYVRNKLEPRPADYEDRKVQIPGDQIVNYDILDVIRSPLV